MLPAGHGCSRVAGTVLLPERPQDSEIRFRRAAIADDCGIRVY